MARKYRKRRSSFEDLTCEQCGHPFRPRPRADRFIRFCGRACYQASRNRPASKQCPQCGVVFIPMRHKAGRPATHCSRACDNKARVTKREHVCRVCDIRFERVRSQNPLYCSHKCQGKTLERNVIKTCEWCKRDYKCKPSVSRDRRFCSRACIKSKLGETRPERLIREALEDLGITFIQEHKIARYRIDFFLPDYGIALEADGMFWHTNPVGRLRDERRDVVVLSKGVRTIRITEAELNNARDIIRLVYDRLSPHLIAA